MRAKQELQRYLTKKQISYTLPETLNTDEISNNRAFDFIYRNCERLDKIQPSLLTENNLEKLIKVAIKANTAKKQDCFTNAITRLDQHNPCILTQHTFNAICENQLTLRRVDLQLLTSYFYQMGRLNLLTPANSKKIVNYLAKLPLQSSSSLQITIPDYQTSFLRHNAENFLRWMSQCVQMTQDNFDFFIRAKNVALACDCMDKLRQQGLGTPENCQAVMDIGFRDHHDFQRFSIPDNQTDFYGYLYEVCKGKLDRLDDLIRLYAQDLQSVQPTGAYNEIHRHAVSLHKKLAELFATPEAQADPRKLLHILAVVTNTLPHSSHTPMAHDIDELKALGAEVQGHPSNAWQEAGKIMMILGGAIALAVGIILTFTTVGIASPLGISLAATGVAASVTALVGLGLFGTGKLRTGISRDVVNLADDLEAFHPPVAATSYQ